MIFKQGPNWGFVNAHNEGRSKGRPLVFFTDEGIKYGINSSSYDGLNWITAANCQKNGLPSVDYNAMYGYDKMGNLTSLQRYGLSAKPSTFSLIDDQAMSYTVNRLSVGPNVSPVSLFMQENSTLQRRVATVRSTLTMSMEIESEIHTRKLQ